MLWAGLKYETAKLDQTSLARCNVALNGMQETIIFETTEKDRTIGTNFMLQRHGCGHSTCCFPQIRNGGTSDGDLISRLCGGQLPQPISSASNLMYIKFVSDGSVNNHGFMGVVEFREGVAGNQLISEQPWLLCGFAGCWHGAPLSDIRVGVAGSQLIWMILNDGYCLTNS